jgi:malto-oligosyltrehalose synthase
MIVRATMRLQMHKGFTFDEAASAVPYLSALGISHVYSSPIMTARAGSMHGYDVTDPSRVNPELGGEQGLERLSRALRQHAMGLIVDIVPNHMAVGSDNSWWMDVLAHGRASRYARFFDIDWEGQEKSLQDKVLLPILGRAYGDALAAGEIRLAREDERGFIIRYFDHVAPVSPRDWADIERQSLDAFDPAAAEGRERLHRLLDNQHYRLCWWRAANDLINWRRFFDINDLVALRMEDDEAFEAVHATTFRLYEAGIIDGLRIDHIDGLARPHDYCRKLRARLEPMAKARSSAERVYIVVEKILASGEQLPQTWGTDGTSGYDFMDAASAVLHDPAGEEPLGALWERVSGRSAGFDIEEIISRRQILQQSFSAQFDGVVRVLSEIAGRDLRTRDFTRAAIRRCLAEILVHFPVYRIYASVGSASPSDRAFLSEAVERAVTTGLPGDRVLLPVLGEWLLGQAISSDVERLQAIALTRFQQLSAPLSAKAVEDTAFYRYGRLLSRNDVGFDPRHFASSPADFHQNVMARRERYPDAMLATATHDHKRGEDVRARIAVLSEIADEWAAHLDRWIAASAQLGATAAPTPGDLTILFETMVGAWPLDLTLDDSVGLAGYAERLVRWQQKAMREAKLFTDWSEPNGDYESAAQAFVARLFDDRAGLLAAIAAFAHRIAAAGAANGLAQTLLKLAAPGVPDIYQGTDYWDLSLVDPDNRRPVDFEARRRTLKPAPWDALCEHWVDGRIKQALIAQVLAIRQSMPRLFSEGAYVPIEVEGARAAHIIAFARIHGGSVAVTLACRLTAGMRQSQGTLGVLSSLWADTRLVLPAEIRAMPLTNVFDPTAPAIRGFLDLGATFARLPVALLLSAAVQA